MRHVVATVGETSRVSDSGESKVYEEYCTYRKELIEEQRTEGAAGSFTARYDGTGQSILSELDK